ncbi:MAG: protein translocase subunit SecF [Patescibacteria group bacterium]
MKTFNIINKRYFWLSISAGMLVVGIVALALWQLKFGIDFTGGSLLEVAYSQSRPPLKDLNGILEHAGIKDAEIKPSGERGVIFRFKTVDEPTHQAIIAGLKKEDSALVERSFDSIGPIIGSELKQKSIIAIVLALVMILLYISFVFRKVSFPVASWKYGTCAIIALFHDLLFVLGIFAFLGHFGGIEVNSSFIPAFLTVLGFSVHDTIVVFDRIRENLTKFRGEFEDIVNKSLNETIVRSINTSLTVLLVLLAIFFFGGETIKTFSLALLLGIAIGTYSSIFVASPMLVAWNEWEAKHKK